MSDAVLPSFLVLLVVWELGYDEAVDVIQGQLLLLAFSDGHCNESHVGIRWLFGGCSGSSIPCGTRGVLCGIGGWLVSRLRAAIHEMGLSWMNETARFSAAHSTGVKLKVSRCASVLL